MGCGGGGIILAKGFEKVGFSSRFFVALLAICIVRGVHAADCTIEMQNCPAGRYNSYGCQTGTLLHHTTGYSCVPCPNTFPMSDSGIQQTINDCYKLADCKQYHDGRMADGENYHVESDTCYNNERSCNSFGNEVPNVSAVSCQVQDGSAIWNGNEWNVSNCTCVSPVVSGVNGDLNCAEFGTSLNLVSNQSVTSVNDKVQYEIVRLYCNKCLPGYIPRVVPSMTNAGISTRPDDNRDWGCMACDQVHAPNYAPGCVINFGWNNSTDVVSNCTQPCPDGFETTVNGATSMDACQYDGQTTYMDGTGTFYINSLDECP